MTTQEQEIARFCDFVQKTDCFGASDKKILKRLRQAVSKLSAYEIALLISVVEEVVEQTKTDAIHNQ